MGWWGYGVMDGDDASDAAWMLRKRAFGGKDLELGELVADEYDDVDYEVGLTDEDRDILRTHVHGNIDAIVRGAMKDARENWKWGGTAMLVATGYLLVDEYKVKHLPKKFKEMFAKAVEFELDEEADSFDNARARMREIKDVASLVQKTKGY